jgi:hypothetical protein
MEIDRFWDLIEQARLSAGPAADQAVRDGRGVEDHPWLALDFGVLEKLETTGEIEWDPVPKLSPDASTHPGESESVPETVETDHDADEDDPVAVALIRVLARLSATEIVEFERAFDQVRVRADRADLANASALIEHGFLSDDGFDDFRAGLVALGRATYEAALRDPDSLAGHPLVQEIAAAEDNRWLGREDLLYAAGRAYTEATGQDEITFLDLVAEGESDDEQTYDESVDNGWNLANEAETRRRLPRLSALFLERVLSRRA